jgi:hypothetical protein
MYEKEVPSVRSTNVVVVVSTGTRESAKHARPSQERRRGVADGRPSRPLRPLSTSLAAGAKGAAVPWAAGGAASSDGRAARDARTESAPPRRGDHPSRPARPRLPAGRRAIPRTACLFSRSMRVSNPGCASKARRRAAPAGQNSSITSE